jgi:hypothetical protein
VRLLTLLVFTVFTGQLVLAQRSSSEKAGGESIVDVRSCGAKGDGITDDGPAIQACIDANKGATIYLPKTRSFGSVDYFVGTAACGTSGNDHFALCMNGHGQRLIGNTYGQGGSGQGVTIRFAPGLTGILVPNSNAISGVPTRNVGCQGCSVENINLQGSEPYLPDSPITAVLPGIGDTSVSYGSSTGTSQADGIRCAGSYCTVINVGVFNFGRHGFYFDGNSGRGNFADSSSLINGIANNNRGSGLFNRGSDSNASVVIGLKCTGNQLWCVENYSFLGSTFIGGTAHSQHVDNMKGRTSVFEISRLSNSGNVTRVTTTIKHNFTVGMAAVISGTTNYNGTFFVASVPASNQFTFVQTSPIATENAGRSTNATATQMWAAASGDAVGGCVRSTGGAVTSVFVNPYCESDNSGKNMVNPATTLVIGGVIGRGWDWGANPPNWITTDAGGLSMTPTQFKSRLGNGKIQDASVRVGGLGSSTPGAGDNTVFEVENGNVFAAPAGSKAALYFRLTDATSGGGVWGWRCCGNTDSAGLANYAMYMEYGATTGTNNSNPKAGFPNGFWHGFVGPSTGKLWFGNVSAVANLPTIFTQPIGSIAINNRVTSGGYAGWIATSAGKPGTYNAFGPVANDSTGTSWTLPELNLIRLVMKDDAAFTSAPRMTYTAFIPNLSAAPGAYARFTIDKAITVTRLQMVLGTAPSCKTQARIAVTDGTTSHALTTSNGSRIYDSGPIVKNYPSGATVDLTIEASAAGCGAGESPANANLVVQYRMQ